MMAFLICISMTACMEKQSYAEFDEGTQHVVFKDLEIDIPSAWVMDEEESTDNSVWYHKNVRSVTQSMFYMSSGQTKEDLMQPMRKTNSLISISSNWEEVKA